MTKETDLASRVATLEKEVAELRAMVAGLREQVAGKSVASGPVLRSRGMLDRPKTGR